MNSYPWILPMPKAVPAALRKNVAKGPPGTELPSCTRCGKPVYGHTTTLIDGKAYCSFFECAPRSQVSDSDILEPLPPRPGTVQGGCLCEPVPFQISEVFIKGKVHYEHDRFKGTRCGWHHEKRGAISNENLKEFNDLWNPDDPFRSSLRIRVSVSSAKSVYVTVRDDVPGRNSKLKSDLVSWLRDPDNVTWT